MSDAASTLEDDGPKGPRPRARRAEALDARDGLRPVQGPPAPPSELPRSREERVETERRERRMRADVMDGDYEYKLVPIVPLDKATYQYRWELDEPGRLESFYVRDWDKVEGQPPIHAYNDGLTAVHYHLLCKYRDWYADDQRRRKEGERATMDAIKRAKPSEDFGKTPDGSSAQYTHNKRGEAIDISFERSDRLR